MSQKTGMLYKKVNLDTLVTALRWFSVAGIQGDGISMFYSRHSAKMFKGILGCDSDQRMLLTQCMWARSFSCGACDNSMQLTIALCLT